MLFLQSFQQRLPRFFWLVSLFSLGLFLFVPSYTYAAYERAVVVTDGPFSLSGVWGGILDSGPSSARVDNASLLHRVEIAESSLTMISGDRLTFSFSSDDPSLEFRGGIFGGERLIGGWVSSLNSRGDCSPDPLVFSGGSEQYSFVSCGIRPTISLSSSDASVVSCSGMSCVSNEAGSARITASISNTSIKMWGNRSSAGGWIELVSTEFPRASVSWDVVVARPPTLTFSAAGGTDPLAPLSYDTATTLSWSAQYASDCIASGDWSSSRGISGSWNTGNLQARRDYTLTCSGAGGTTVRQTISIFVGSPSAGPVISLRADANPVPFGISTTLRWSATNAFSCEAIGDWLSPGSQSTSGSQSTGNLTSVKTYILSCAGASGSNAVQLTVFVGASFDPPSFVSFTATPGSVSYNGGTQLSWNVRSASSCTASSLPVRADWQGLKSVATSQNISGLTSTTSFTLDCVGSGGSVSRAITVTVAPIGLPDPNLDFSVDDADLFVDYNGSVLFRWNASHVNWCEGVGGWMPRTATNFNGSWNTGPIAASRNFTFRCGNNFSQTVERTIPIAVGVPGNPVEITSFSADASMVSGEYWVGYNTSTTLRWSVQNAVSCEMNQNGTVSNWGMLYGFSGSRSTGRLTANQRYILTCRNSFGSVSSTVLVNIGSGGSGFPFPSLSFVSDSTYVAYNTGTILSWSTTNADNCVASSNPIVSSWSGSKSLSGTFFTGNLRNRTVFSLDCSGPGGVIPRRSITVQVGDPLVVPPEIRFWADRFSVASGESTVLRWTTVRATSCAPFGAWSGSIGTSGSRTVGPLLTSSTFRIRCSNAGGNLFQSVLVTVGASPSPPSVALWADAPAVSPGGSTMLHWSAQNVTSCTASALPDTPLWRGDLSFLGARNTGPLVDSMQYDVECSGPGGTVLARANVGVGVSAFGPTISLFNAEASVISAGETPRFYLSSENTDDCCISRGNNSTWDLCVAASGSLGTSSVSGVEIGGPVHADAEYWAVCRNSSMGLSVSRWLSLNVGQVLVCPLTNLVSPGNTTPFSAWYIPGGGANCLSDFSAMGGYEITSSLDPPSTWSVENGTGEIQVNQSGVVTGVRSGSARVRVSFKPRNASTFFSGVADVTIGTPLTCYRCESDLRCSSVPVVSFDTPPVCSSGLFRDSFRCRLSCSKNRWKEVAP